MKNWLRKFIIRFLGLQELRPKAIKATDIAGVPEALNGIDAKVDRSLQNIANLEKRLAKVEAWVEEQRAQVG